MQRGSKKNSELLSEEILKMGEVSRATTLEKADYGELVYKLTLKYLRQKGYDIGYNKIPRVKALLDHILSLVEEVAAHW
jgi:hypothetical protein